MHFKKNNYLKYNNGNIKNEIINNWVKTYW